MKSTACDLSKSACDRDEYHLRRQFFLRFLSYHVLLILILIPKIVLLNLLPEIVLSFLLFEPRVVLARVQPVVRRHATSLIVLEKRLQTVFLRHKQFKT